MKNIFVTERNCLDLYRINLNTETERNIHAQDRIT